MTKTEPPDKSKLPHYKCIKTSLKGVVKYDFVIDNLIQSSNMCNKIVSHTLQLLKLYLLYRTDNKLDLPKIDKQFVNAVMKTVCKAPTQGRSPSESTQGIKENLKAFYDTHYRDLQKEELNYRYMNTVLDYLAIDIITMYENNIKQHFVEYVERYVNVVWRKKALVKLIKQKYKTPKTRQERINKLCSAMRKVKNDILNPTKEKTSPTIYHSWIDKEITNILPTRPFQKDSIYYDIMCSPQDYLPCMFYIMKTVESYGESVNSVCPLRTDIIPKYIRIDTTTLVHLLFTKKQGNKSDYLTNGNLVKHQEKLWSFFFKTNKKCFHLNDDNKYKFHYMIETDGVGCSILLIRKDLEGKKLRSPKVSLNTEKYIDELNEMDYDRLKTKKVVGIDPNHSDLIYCMDADGNTFRYTQNQRRKETKRKKFRNILQQNKLETVIGDKNVVEWETMLSHYNKKTLDFEAFKVYIQHKNEMNIALTSFYQTNLYRKLKLSSFINRMKTEQRMLTRFEKVFGNPDEVVIGFGDYEQYKQRKYKEPTKGKGFRTLFRKYGYEVYLIDEFRTSCRCSACEGGECCVFRECINPRPWKHNSIFRHGLVKCKTCSGLWNRDTNASTNIMKITEGTINGSGRPDYLKRSVRPYQ
jgi:hypothetical protein